MWVVYAFLSAFFAGLVAVFAKIGIRNVDSNLATAIRTVVIALLSWAIVFITGNEHGIGLIDSRSMLFLVLSGLATGASWLCYFRALQLGNINKVVPVDKSSVLLTMVLSWIFLGEALSGLKIFSMGLIGVGTYLMIERKKAQQKDQNSTWFIYASLSAIFASLTSILGKIGIENVQSNLGTAIRTIVILLISWLIVFFQKKHRGIKQINSKSWIFLVLSGIVTGLSWLCYYRALQGGPASVVVPIDKLSIVTTILFSYFFFHEELGRKAKIGLALLVAGTMLLLL